MQNAGLYEAQARIKASWRNINNLIYADDTTLMAENEEELNSLMMKVKEKSDNAGSTFRKLRSWHPVPLLHGVTMETVTDFLFLAPKLLQMVTVVMKLKTPAPWKKSNDQPRQHIKKQRHHLPTNVHLVKAMVFPVVMYGCESWTIKNAEC